MAISTRIQQGQRRLREVVSRYDQVQGEATADALRRFMLLLWFALPMHMLLTVWFGRYHAPADQLHLQQWADTRAWLDTSLVGALALLGFWAHRLLGQGKGQSPAARAVQIATCTSYLAFGAAASILEASIGNGIATYLAVAMGTATLSLLRPWLSACVFLASLVFFIAGLSAQDVPPALRSSMLIQAISTLLMVQLVAMVMWHQYVARILLQRELQATNAALQQQQALQTLAERDTLTGLYNRRKFMQIAEQELARTARMPAAVSLLLVDMDHFKRINDHFGHPAGDAVLQHAADLLAGHVRQTDTVARLGGEEFIVLMPQTPAEGALALAEKLRLAVRGQTLDWHGQCIGVTASLGVSSACPGEHTSFEALYGAADQALYAAKNQGRDRVVLAASADPAGPAASAA